MIYLYIHNNAYYTRINKYNSSRSMRAPPEIIRDILEGVLTLMGILDTSWNSMKSFLAKRGIKEEIKYVWQG